ncbi:MAG: alpha/beta hydrolase [Spirulina sp. SIO3F2]|nr:alpha/beta hydrolase [Spirulina sp. SIO3F2]
MHYNKTTLQITEEHHLAYREWGQGTKKFLLLHGLADHSGVWTNLAASLGEDYHIIAPDLRGHGDSSKPETGYDCEDMIADVRALCRRLNWQQFSLLGHSWGGKLACIWATEFPEEVERLILVDPAFIGAMPSWLKITFPLLYQTLPFLKAMGPFESQATAETTAQNFKQYRGWSDFQAEVFRDSIEAKLDGRWGSKFTIAARNGIFNDVMAVNGLYTVLDVPTLLVLPKQGLNRTDLQLRPYRTYLKSLTEQWVPGNHWPFLVEPDAFNQAVGAFLAA